jgi:ribose/xylose/arabinose/galactoside ABC-type transport system permease subunit
MTMLKESNKIALNATLHCLTGCAIGEVAGLILGTIFGWSNLTTIIAAIAMAFAFGYTLSLIPLVKSGMSLAVAMPLVLAADTLSIFTMEVVDNATVAVIPGAMNAGLVNPVFWMSLFVSLFLAFWAAFPVNRYLISKGKGHALAHNGHH